LSFADAKMDILEPMCGSGRFFVGFLERGFRMDGFDLSREMLERCVAKIEKLKGGKKNSLLKCCGFDGFPTSKEYDYVLIPSGSFSLMIRHDEIMGALKALERLCKKNRIIVLELEINENIAEKRISDAYSRIRSAKEGGIEIVASGKTIRIDEKENVEYSMGKYELYENGKFIREEEEAFNLKYYAPTEFEKYLQGTSFKVVSKYVGYEKEEDTGQKTESILYVLTH